MYIPTHENLGLCFKSVYKMIYKKLPSVLSWKKVTITSWAHINIGLQQTNKQTNKQKKHFFSFGL